MNKLKLGFKVKWINIENWIQERMNEWLIKWIMNTSWNERVNWFPGSPRKYTCSALTPLQEPDSQPTNSILFCKQTKTVYTPGPHNIIIIFSNCFLSYNSTINTIVFV